jgi:hypothetical protein
VIVNAMLLEGSVLNTVLPRFALVGRLQGRARLACCLSFLEHFGGFEMTTQMHLRLYSPKNLANASIFTCSFATAAPRR